MKNRNGAIKNMCNPLVGPPYLSCLRYIATYLGYLSHQLIAPDMCKDKAWKHSICEDHFYLVL